MNPDVRAVAVSEAVTVVELPPLVAVAVTVPESTMVPDHVVLVLPLALETVAPLIVLDVNFQFDAVPGPCKVQVVCDPLVTEAGEQLSEFTFTVFWGVKV